MDVSRTAIYDSSTAIVRLAAYRKESLYSQRPEVWLRLLKMDPYFLADRMCRVNNTPNPFFSTIATISFHGRCIPGTDTVESTIATRLLFFPTGCALRCARKEVRMSCLWVVGNLSTKIAVLGYGPTSDIDSTVRKSEPYVELTKFHIWKGFWQKEHRRAYKE